MEQINKTIARRLYNNGYNVIIVPCKCSPYSMFSINTNISNNDLPFDKLINTIEYYNCNYETGYYCHYYTIEPIMTHTHSKPIYEIK